MKFLFQFYFILYEYYYNRYQYLSYSIKFSPEGNASNVIAISFFGWIILFYFSLFKIFGFPVFNKYGQSIMVFTGLLGLALIRNYFTTNTRYLKIYNEYLNQDLKKIRIIVSAVIFFILPFLILTLLFLIGWL